MAIDTTSSLDDLIGAPLQSISRAQSSLERARIEMLESYMHTDDHGRLRPRTIDIEFGGAGGRRVVPVPLLSLVQVPSLTVREASVEMVSELRHQVRPSKKAKQPPPLPGSGASPPAPQLRCRLSSTQARARNPRMATMTIKLTVEAVEPSEATQRVRDRLNAYLEGKTSRAKSTKGP